MDDQPKPTPVEAPRGFFAAHVDDKGRLKLPVAFQQYLEGIGDQTLYVTSVDGRIGRIYPISVWKENEKRLEDLEREDPDAAEAIVTLSSHYGAEAKMDASGRVTLSPEMRQDLKLEKDEVRVGVMLGAINIYSRDEYAERLAKSRTNLNVNLNTAKMKGFK